jgi:hypothetical protein
MEAADAHELIEEALEESEARHERVEHREKTAERQFRDRASVLVGVFAVLLAIVHTAAASAQRESMLSSIEASDNFAYMQAKRIRETVLLTASRMPGLESETRAAELGEAMRLRQPDAAGHGIAQLQAEGSRQRQLSTNRAIASEGYEFGETALQVAIVMLSIAMITMSRRLMLAAGGLAGCGVLLALLTMLGVQLP